ncbi:MAG: hypothetical protein II863_02110, partial [Kiritimatiellae bacterium]|nr:hypothetical protein [Kiritimatiellia bacterium]
RHGALASLGNIDRTPARCIHRPQRDTSSAGYRLLVSRASVGASRERGLLRPLTRLGLRPRATRSLRDRRRSSRR